MRTKIRVGLVGLGFGINYLNAYIEHPDVEYVGICDVSEVRLNEVGRKHGISRLYRSLDEMVSSSEFDAVHLMTQVPDHAAQTRQVLGAGIHCACTIPMGVSMDELGSVAESVKRSNRRYMLMEPNAYLPETLYVKGLYESGEMGRIQFMRGRQTYYLNDHTCQYWRGMPPMHYVSHVLAPLLTITGARVKAVRCMGSGWMREELTRPHKNPFPIEIALMELDLPGVIAEIEIQFFETAVAQLEGFEVYGEKLSFTWPNTLVRLTDPSGYGGTAESVEIPSPDSIAEPLKTLCEKTPLRFSGPVHEFVRSIIEEREPELGISKSWDIHAPGILSHESAMNDGRRIEVPACPFTG